MCLHAAAPPLSIVSLQRLFSFCFTSTVHYRDFVMLMLTFLVCVDWTDYVLIPLLMMAKMQKIICCYEGKFLLPVIPDLPFLMFSIL